MRRIEWSTIAIVILWIFVGLWMLISSKRVGAQDAPIIVCRDVEYGALRFEFRNIPPPYFTYGSDAHWGYWAGGVSFDLENLVIIADPLEADTDGHAINTVYLVDYDTRLEFVGDENTQPCDLPIKTTSESDSCPAWSFNSLTGLMICLWDLPKAKE